MCFWASIFQPLCPSNNKYYCFTVSQKNVEAREKSETTHIHMHHSGCISHLKPCKNNILKLLSFGCCNTPKCVTNLLRLLLFSVFYCRCFHRSRQQANFTAYFKRVYRLLQSLLKPLLY